MTAERFFERDERVINWRGCDHCDSPGGEKTYKNQVCLPLRQRVEGIDYCIHHIVAALNAGGITTMASCCGHNTLPGLISLEDDRVLVIFDSLERTWDYGLWHPLEQKKQPFAGV